MKNHALAQAAYHYAERNYGKKDARYDVIVECMSLDEIAEEFEQQGINDEPAAYKWADQKAGLMHEVELNQAWDGPESVKSSSHYNPKYDAHGEWIG